MLPVTFRSPSGVLAYKRNKPTLAAPRHACALGVAGAPCTGERQGIGLEQQAFGLHAGLSIANHAY